MKKCNTKSSRTSSVDGIVAGVVMTILLVGFAGTLHISHQNNHENDTTNVQTEIK